MGVRRCAIRRSGGQVNGILILGIIVLTAILIFGGYIVLSVMNAAMWMDDSMRWGGRDDS